MNEVIKNGRALGRRDKCPLMFEWYGERYWGAAHGLAGIMHVLMDMELLPDEVEDVKGTLRYMSNNHFASGNYPASEKDKSRDVLVHWCHGAPGIALTLVKAARVSHVWKLSPRFGYETTDKHWLIANIRQESEFVRSVPRALFHKTHVVNPKKSSTSSRK